MNTDLKRQFHSAKLDLLQSGKQVIDLSMINPDCDAPRELQDKLVEFSLKPHSSRYAVSRGIKPLREAFAEKYKSLFSIQLSSEYNICVTQGFKDAFLSLLHSICHPGQKVLLPNPCYIGHMNATVSAHLEDCYYNLASSSQEILDNISNALNSHDPDVLVLNFPHNPTGLVVDREFFLGLEKITADRDLLIINDFVYGELEYSKRNSTSLLQGKSDFTNLIEIYSLSKAYSVPGWRVAAALGDSSIVAKLSDYKTRIDYGIFLPVQFAATYALNSKEDICKKFRDLYQGRAEYLSNKLLDCGCSIENPEAGCSLWVALPDNSMPAYDFALKLLQEHCIVIQPGEFYGQGHSKYVRIALVVDEEKLGHVANGFEDILYA